MYDILIETAAGFLTTADFREFWEVGPIDHPAMALVSEDASVHIGVTHAGVWFILTWAEHPDGQGRDEFYNTYEPEEAGVLREENWEQFPPVESHREITRREASGIIMAWCVPDEFHPDVQLVP